MVYIIMESWGKGSTVKEVFTSERKCKKRLSELYFQTMKELPNAVQIPNENGMCFNYGNTFISYQMVTMTISK